MRTSSVLISIFSLCCFAIFASRSTAQTTPPILECVHVISPSGHIELSWSAGNLTCGAAFQGFEIYVSSNSNSGFTLLNTIIDPLATSYVDMTSNAASTLYYYVATNCSGTLYPSATISTQPPQPPTVAIVTVGNDTTSIISWTSSTSPQAAGYIIYTVNTLGALQPIDTVFSPTVTSYIDTSNQPGEMPISYRVATIDKCLLSGPDNGVTHTTVHLAAETSECSRDIQFDWTPYEGWADGVLQYDIVEESNGTFTVVGTTNGTTTQFTYTFPENQDAGCFRINAVKTSGFEVSNSNLVCVDVNLIQGPEMVLKTANVLPDNTVSLSWTVALTTPPNYLEIMRASGSGSNFTDIATITNGISSNMDYTDTEAEGNIRPYGYRVDYINECDQRTASNEVRTIFLRGKDQFNLSNNLEWTPFVLGNAVVSSYQIFRADTPDSPFTQVGSVNGDVLEYADEVTTTGTQNCYYIVATYTLTLPDGSTEILTSTSNRHCIIQSSRIFVPNAFVPGGVNNIFKPIVLYPNESTYSLKIVNRWGEVVFTSNQIDNGWDGYQKGVIAPQGVYGYVIKMTSNTGVAIEKKGSVMLLRE